MTKVFLVYNAKLIAREKAKGIRISFGNPEILHVVFSSPSLVSSLGLVAADVVLTSFRSL